MSSTMSMEASSKIEYLQRENKLLTGQQNNYKDLCKVLTDRHVEILKYLGHLKEYIDKLLVAKGGILYNSYQSDKNQHETTILKYDQQIQLLTQTIQTSNEQISDNEGIQFKEQLKLLSSSLNTLPTQSSNSNHLSVPVTTSTTVSNSTLLSNHSYGKYCCEFYECGEEFDSQEQLESHFRVQHNESISMNEMNTTGGGENHHFMVFTNNLNAKKNDIHKPGLSESLFIPQMQLEELEYSNNGYSLMNTAAIQHGLQSHEVTDNGQPSSSSQHPQPNSQQQHSHLGLDKSNGFKKMAVCDFCGKYFNKHYLESHKRSHTGVKPFKCSVDGCGRTFTQSSSRNFHEKRFHSLSKQNNVYKCTYQNCEETFFQIENFQKHSSCHPPLEHHPDPLSPPISLEMIKKEDGVRLQKPPAPKQPGGFVHKKTNNTTTRCNNFGVKPHKYVCDVCSKSFPYKIALRQHSQLHGEKNYRCIFDNCSYASYWKHNLNLHLRKHHNAEPQ